MNSVEPNYFSQLLNLIDKHLNLDDIQNLCLFLNIDYEHLSGQTKPAKIIALLLHQARRNDIERLLEFLRGERPRVNWPNPPEDIDLANEIIKMEELTNPSLNYIGERGVNVGNNVFGSIITGDNNTIIINSSEDTAYTKSTPLARDGGNLLPSPTNSIFVGRINELAWLTEKINENHPIVIWGAAGIGKTSLAIELANRRKHLISGNLIWLDCKEDSSFETLLNNLGSFLGLAIENLVLSAKEIAIYQAFTSSDQKFLLIWDNVESVWFSGLSNPNQALERFINQLPVNCQIILTTRQDLEQPIWPTLELSPLNNDSMEKLFWELAKSSQTKIDIKHDLVTIQSILAWLNGHPLALILSNNRKEH